MAPSDSVASRGQSSLIAYLFREVSIDSHRCHIRQSENTRSQNPTPAAALAIALQEGKQRPDRSRRTEKQNADYFPVQSPDLGRNQASSAIAWAPRRYASRRAAASSSFTPAGSRGPRSRSLSASAASARSACRQPPSTPSSRRDRRRRTGCAPACPSPCAARGRARAVGPSAARAGWSARRASAAGERAGAPPAHCPRWLEAAVQRRPKAAPATGWERLSRRLPAVGRVRADRGQRAPGDRGSHAGDCQPVDARQARPTISRHSGSSRSRTGRSSFSLVDEEGKNPRPLRANGRRCTRRNATMLGPG